MIYKVNSKHDVIRVLQTYNAIYGLDNFLPDEIAKEFEYGSNGTDYLIVIEFPGLSCFDATWIPYQSIVKGTTIYTPENYPVAFSKILRPNKRGGDAIDDTVPMLMAHSRKKEERQKDNHGYDAVLKEMNESMRDSLLDMCNYIAMTVAWMDKEGKENG